jgi:hypothetical protein
MLNKNVFKLMLSFSILVAEILPQPTPAYPMPIITGQSPAVSQRFQSQDIIYKFDFRANDRNYLFFATRNTDGSVALYVSQPNFQQARPLNIFEINNRFTRKIIQSPRQSSSFVITFAVGNGWSSPLLAYGLDLSNPANPAVKSLSILQEKGVLKDGSPVLASNGNLYRTHTFEGRAGQSVTVTLLSQRAFDHYAAVIAPNGKKIAESYGTQNKEHSKDRTSELNITLPVGGNYRVIVSGKDRSSQGAYTLSVNSNNWVTSASSQTQLTEQSKLALKGIGSIQVGMTVEEASQAAGVRLVKSNGSGRDEYLCSYFELQEGPKGIRFMVTRNRIARVDISNERVTTIKGAKIGDTEDKIFSLYPGQIQATRHPYQGRSPYNGKYLTFVPKDATDKNYRIIFETSKNRVERFRSGKLPEVEAIEGCS